MLDTLARMPREAFVTESLRGLAYADTALPVGHSETMLKPVLEGRILQALLPTATESVLEIGAGSSYLTACLARLAREVVAIERHPDLAEAAQARLAAQGFGNATIARRRRLRLEPGPQLRRDLRRRRGGQHPGAFRRMAQPGRPHRSWCTAARGDGCGAGAPHVNGSRVESLFETDLLYLAGAEPVPAFTL